jgi:predicted transcriptional regulator
MPGKCSICTHPNRLEIEKKISEGVSYRDIAKQFSVSKSAVGNHVIKHIPVAIRQAQADREIESGLNIMEELKRILVELNRLRSEAQETTQEAWRIFNNAKVTSEVNSGAIKFLADTLEKLTRIEDKFVKFIGIQAKLLGVLKEKKEEEPL